MEELMEKLCVNCEYSYTLRTGCCVCRRKDKTIVKEDGCCRHFVPDLLKYTPRINTGREIERPDITGL